MFLCQSAECRYIVLTRKVEPALALLMNVPKDVDTDCIHSQGLARLYALFPIGLRNTWIVQLCRLDDKRFTIQKERTFANGEIVSRSR